MRRILAALVVCPMLALAQGNAPAAPQPPGAPARPDRTRMEERMRLARTLGLAEALDLDSAAALKLRDTLARFDGRREAAHKQLKDAREALRKIASGQQKASAADVDAAIARIFEARAQLQATDKEMLQAVTQNLPPEKRARAALFLGQFESRMHRRVVRFREGGPGPGGTPCAPGGGPGMMGPGGHGHGGPGHEMGMGPAGPGPDRMARGPMGPDDDDEPFVEEE